MFQLFRSVPCSCPLPHCFALPTLLCFNATGSFTLDAYQAVTFSKADCWSSAASWPSTQQLNVHCRLQCYRCVYKAAKMYMHKRTPVQAQPFLWAAIAGRCGDDAPMPQARGKLRRWLRPAPVPMQPTAAHAVRQRCARVGHVLQAVPLALSSSRSSLGGSAPRLPAHLACLRLHVFICVGAVAASAG